MTEERPWQDPHSLSRRYVRVDEEIERFMKLPRAIDTDEQTTPNIVAWLFKSQCNRIHEQSEEIMSKLDEIEQAREGKEGVAGSNKLFVSMGLERRLDAFLRRIGLLRAPCERRGNTDEDHRRR